MKAIIFQSKDDGPQPTDAPKPEPRKGEVLVRLHYAALNHLDLWIWKEATLTTPVISGSDGSGVVEAVGEDVPAYRFGKEVVVNPGLHWGDDEKRYSDAFQILGSDTNGTFAEYIAVPQEYIHPKPAHLSLQEAAALPMAALTAYRALFTKAELKPNDAILITGIGGGVALAALQMATAAGANVYVTSSSGEKITKAIALGAKGGFNYKSEKWISEAKKQAGGFDVIIDSAGGNGFPALTEVANAGARIVLFGRTAGDINDLKPGVIFNKQLRIEGTVMGTPAEFDKMLYFFGQHRLRPIISDTFSLYEVQEAIDSLSTGNNFGKILFSLRSDVKQEPQTQSVLNTNHQKSKQHETV